MREIRPERSEGGLDAYFDAWKKEHVAGEPEKEWTQFQFAKRIEWEPSTLQATEVELAANFDPETLEESKTPPVFHDGINSHADKAQFDVAEEAALAAVDAAIERRSSYETTRPFLMQN